MQRFSVSLDDDLAAWVEQQADKQGVSKAKVIRDTIADAKDSKISPEPSNALKDTVEELEERVNTLETEMQIIREQSVDGAHQEGEEKQALEDEKHERASELLEAVQEHVADKPPQTDHGQAAVLSVVRILRDREEMPASEIQDLVYQRHGDEYSDARSMWTSIQRYFEDIPGIEKAGHGVWEYPGDDVVRDELACEVD